MTAVYEPSWAEFAVWCAKAFAAVSVATAVAWVMLGATGRKTQR